jgi:poly(glycerol-phosphate) alpha-glucosyltransferase
MSMRIVHVVPSAVLEAGSVAIAVRGLVSALRARGVPTDLISGGNGLSTARTPGDAERIRGTLERADLVHIHGWGYAEAEQAARLAQRSAKPWIVSPHGSVAASARFSGPAGLSLLGRLRARRQIRRATAVTAFNQSERNELSRLRLAERLVDLPIGIDAAPSATAESAPFDAPPPSTGHVLLFLGPVDPAEGIVALLKSLAEVGSDADGWNVILAGREVSDWWKMLEPAVRRKGGEGRVRRVDAGDEPQQWHWLSHATALVAPNPLPRCPVSVLQGMAAGLPILATRCVSPPDCDGTIIVCGSVRHEVKAALRTLLGMSDEQRKAAGDRARECLRGRFDWSVLVDRYLELYSRAG